MVYSRPQIDRAFPSVALSRDFNLTVVLKGQYFGFRDDHIDFVSIGGLKCRQASQGADFEVLQRFGGSSEVQAANISLLEGRYITCKGVESVYEIDVDGNLTRVEADEEWPTGDVVVQIAGQRTTSSTVMDLQGAPTVDSVAPVDARATDFDTSGHGKVILTGRGFGLDARDVVAVVFGPW